MEETERGRAMRVRLLSSTGRGSRFSVRSCREGRVEESTDIFCSGGCLDNGSINTGHRKLEGAGKEWACRG